MKYLKSLLPSLLLSLAMCMPAWAAHATGGTLGRSTVTTTSAYGEFSAMTTTGWSDTLDVALNAPIFHTITATVAGSPAGCSIRLETTIDGTNWVAGSGNTCTSTVTFTVTNTGAQAVRVNVTTLSGGSSPSVTVSYLGEKSFGFTSGGVTANVIPKSDGSAELQDSSITDDGTNVSLAGTNLIFGTDNTKDIGADGATRPRDYFGGRSIIAPGPFAIGADATTSTTKTSLAFSDIDGSTIDSPQENARTIDPSTGAAEFAGFLNNITITPSGNWGTPQTVFGDYTTVELTNSAFNGWSFSASSLTAQIGTFGTMDNLSARNDVLYLYGGGGTLNQLFGHLITANDATSSGTTVITDQVGLSVEARSAGAGTGSSTTATGIRVVTGSQHANKTLPTNLGIDILAPNRTGTVGATLNAAIRIGNFGSLSTDYAIKTGTGQVSFGDTTKAPVFDFGQTFSTTTPFIGGQLVYNNAAHRTAAISPLGASLDITNTGLIDNIFFYDNPIYNETTATITNVENNEAFLENVGGGTITRGVAFQALLYNDAAGLVSSWEGFSTDNPSAIGNYGGATGTITNLYHFHAGTTVNAAGTIGTLYGLKVENMTAGSTNYAIYTGTGQVRLGDKITTYNALPTAGQGVPVILGMTSQKAETGAADANVLTVTPAAAAGTYRLSFVLDCSASTAGIAGWTATWKDSNGQAQAPTNLALTTAGVALPALTFTLAANSTYYGEAIINTDNSATNIVIKMTYTSGTLTAKVSTSIERLN